DLLDKSVVDHESSEAYIGEELEWNMTVNESLSRIKDAKIIDTITAGLSFVEESFTITTGSGEELVKDEDYTLNVDTTGEETVLTVTFAEDVTKALTLNYNTIVVAENGQKVNNKVDF